MILKERTGSNDSLKSENLSHVGELKYLSFLRCSYCLKELKHDRYYKEV